MYTKTSSLLLLFTAAAMLSCGAADTAKDLTDELENIVETSASYTITWTVTWTAQSHPAAYPDNAHFSSLVGTTHTDSFSMWTDGGTATAGIKQMAETGKNGDLEDEVDAAVAAGTANQWISAGGLGAAPDSRSITITVDSAYPLLSLTSMIAPSPDWFVGIDAILLHDGTNWIAEKTIEMPAWDAGTDSGDTYKAANQATSPPETIQILQQDTLGIAEGLPAFARLHIERIS